MKHDYFIASRFRNKTDVLDLTAKLREKGKSVYCFVEEYDDSQTPEEYMLQFENTPDWKNAPAIREMFEKDMSALKDSDTLILLLPAGKSAHVEAGAAFGFGKHCIVIGEQKEAESLYLIFNEFYNTVEEFINKLN